MTFTLAGKWLEHLEYKEILYFHRPKTLIDASVQGHETLKEWIKYWCNNVVGRVFAARTQSTIDHSVQTLSFDAKQLALVGDPTVH